MKIIYKYDSNGNYVPGGDLVLDDGAEIPASYTDKPLPIPNWKPVFVYGEWDETITQGELDEIQNRPKLKTETEVLKENQELMQQALDELLLGGL